MSKEELIQFASQQEDGSPNLSGLGITSSSEMPPDSSRGTKGYRSVSINTSQPISPNACLILFLALSAAA